MSDQEKFENVIKGLECYLTMRRGEKVECKMEYCPYWSVDDDTGFSLCNNYQIEAEALALLKAQESRLITEDDFANADDYGYLPAWVENHCTSEMYFECIPIHAITDPDSKGEYRFWTSRPTDEQRKAVKWDG